MKQFSPVALSCIFFVAAGLTSCTKPTRIVIGSKTSTEQVVVAEITAQFLEHRLGKTANVVRQFNMGNTSLVHQALINGSIDLYPEDSGLVLAEILHKTPDIDPTVTFNFAKAELARTELLDLLDPLGFDNRTVIAIPASLPANIRKLSDASEVPGTRPTIQWKPVSTTEFISREAGIVALNLYHLPMGAAPRTAKPADFFPLMQKGDVNMVATQASDPHLLSADWRVLQDDMNVFPPRQTALLLRQELSVKLPQLKTMLAELSGKISLENIRKFNAEVALEDQKPADVATKFLASMDVQ